MDLLATGLIENTPVSGVRPTSTFTVKITNNDTIAAIIQTYGFFVTGATKTLYVLELFAVVAGEVVTKNYTAQFDAFEFQFMISSDALEISAWGKNASGNLVAAHRVLPAELNTVNLCNRQSIGKCSLAEGYNTIAKGDFSHAEGNGTNADGISSHTEGNSTIASGIFSHAEGFLTTAGDAAHAEGALTTASGPISHTEGFQTTANGDFSHAEGYFSSASGNGSHVEGVRTTASDFNSHAEGALSTAGGNTSHAEGFRTIASGGGSHAEGMITIASGFFSHAEGNQTTTNGFDGAHIMGRFGAVNNTNGDPTYSWNVAYGAIPNDPTGLVGKLLNNGNMYIDGAYLSPAADYAELFETVDGNSIDVGYFVTTKCEKIKKATASDQFILGVTSATPSLIGNSAGLRWQGKYLTDEWGRKKYHEVIIPAQTNILIPEGEEIIIPAQTDQEGNVLLPEKRIPIPAQTFTIPERKSMQPMLNPEWNPSEEYIPRTERSEWVAVGLIGKVLIHDDGTCEADDYCQPTDEGIATKAEQGYRVLKRTGINQIMILFR